MIFFIRVNLFNDILNLTSLLLNIAIGLKQINIIFKRTYIDQKSFTTVESSLTENSPMIVCGSTFQAG